MEKRSRDVKLNRVRNISHTASGAWQVASIAYTASKLLSSNGIFMKSACIIK
jgi:hypothetical protein